MLGAELTEVGAHQSRQPTVFRQQLVGEIEDAAAPAAGVQDNCQQLGCRERLGTEVLQAFTRALMAG